MLVCPENFPAVRVCRAVLFRIVRLPIEKFETDEHSFAHNNSLRLSAHNKKPVHVMCHENKTEIWDVLFGTDATAISVGMRYKRLRAFSCPA
jgi:hypothetical protein